ncbi:hypothetical protein INT48_000766 [Thamnidium elegans]|uniref:C3H1-type domain-containing protein n=1 Tax=Thamnidium elegans TaxID=101142 RepID=A0A8H7STW1_9FUNG|nr:hypothetical protein INT48_000766 [Thamnidium elegans]
METANRRHLANMRVVQKNLVYIIGLHPKLATEETIRSPDYFGQFGKISKIVINKRQIAPTSLANGATSMQPSAAVYVTYQRKEDAGKAIHAVDASYGTTKYCTYYLRNMTCPNPSCLYLHEPGEDADTISKEELATGKHHFPAAASSSNKKSIEDERSALPPTASWGKTSTPGTPVNKNTGLPERALTPDTFGPPLAVAVAQQQQQSQQQRPQLSPSTLKRKLEKKKLNFVLGDAFEEVCSPTRTRIQEEKPVGVTGLYEGSSDEDTPTTPPTLIEFNMSTLNLNQSISPLEYLTQTIPIPSYTVPYLIRLFVNTLDLALLKFKK